MKAGIALGHVTVEQYSLSRDNLCKLKAQGESQHSCFDLMLCDIGLRCITSRCLSRNKEPRRKVKRNGVNSVKRQTGAHFTLFVTLPLLSVAFSVARSLHWWICQWFITNVSGRRSRLLFCPCQSKVEPEVGSFAYQSTSLPLSTVIVSTKFKGLPAPQHQGLSWKQAGSDTTHLRFHPVDAVAAVCFTYRRLGEWNREAGFTGGFRSCVCRLQRHWSLQQSELCWFKHLQGRAVLNYISFNALHVAFTDNDHSPFLVYDRLLLNYRCM